MNLTDFAERLEAKNIKIEPSEQPGSVIVKEKMWNPLTGKPMPENVSNVRIEQVEAEKANLLKQVGDQIQRIEAERDTRLANLDAALEACRAFVE